MNSDMKKSEIIYLDNAATTRTDDEAASLALKMMCELYANPSSAHSFGFEVEKQVKAAREKIISALGYKSTQGTLIFTSGGTESDNMALRGAVKTLSRKGKHIVISDSEHPAVENTVKELESTGYTVSRIPTKGGRLDMDFAKQAMTPDTVLVSCMTANNETGAVYDVASLNKLKKQLCPDAYFHTDAVQAFTKVKNLSYIDADMISVSAHKIHAPKGVGALFVKKGVRVPAMITGGGQEGTLRSGTEAVSSICAFGLAAEMAAKNYEREKAHITELNEYMRNKLAENENVRINTGTNGFLPHIISIAVPGIRSEIMLRFLSERGSYVSAGSACSSKSADNRVLSAYGLENYVSDSTLRISFSKYNTKEQIDKFVLNLNEGIRTLISVKPQKHN